MYLLVAGSMFIFTACTCSSDDAAVTEETAVEEVVVEEVAVEEVVEAVGCQVEGGTCLEDHSCCVPATEATCCCGDETCDGSCHGDTDTGHDHEGHDHGAEGHSHE